MKDLLRIILCALVAGGSFALATPPAAPDDCPTTVIEQEKVSPESPQIAGVRSGQSIPISKYLSPDGTLNLPPEGIQGSLDPTGFRMSSGRGGKPQFAQANPDETRSTSGGGCWISQFNSQGMDGRIYALAWDGISLYAGGDIAMVGGIPVSNISRWNGTEWTPLGLGVDSLVAALAWDGSNLYAGGYFTTAAEQLLTISRSGMGPLGAPSAVASVALTLIA